MASERFWIERAKQEKEEAEKRIQNAFRRIPSEYHDFIVLMKQSVKIGEPGPNFQVTQEMRELGMWYKDGVLYVIVKVPYMSVDGRVQWARDEHKKAGKKLMFHPPVIDRNAGLVSVTVESEILGSATGTAKIGNGSGVDKTNPIENAETSAIGRALGFLGYGLIGTGIASAEEISASTNELKDMETKQEQKQVKVEAKNTEQQTQAKWITGKVEDYNIIKVKDKDFITFELQNGEKIYVPAQYPFQFDIDGAVQFDKTISFYVISKGQYYIIAGMSGNEIKVEDDTGNEDEDFDVEEEI